MFVFTHNYSHRNSYNLHFNTVPKKRPQQSRNVYILIDKNHNEMVSDLRSIIYSFTN